MEWLQHRWTAQAARAGELLLACVAEHGSAHHAYLASGSLAAAPTPRNLADAIISSRRCTAATRA